MRNLGIHAMTFLAGIAFGTAALGDGMTHAQYEANEERIEQDYKVAKARCQSMAGHAKEICVVEAKGNESVAKADLEARHEPTAKNIQDARKARAEARYSLAMERCEDKANNPEEVCKEEAKAARARDLADGTTRTETSEERDAGYALARASCDFLSGDPKDRCLDDARNVYTRP